MGDFTGAQLLRFYGAEREAIRRDFFTLTSQTGRGIFKVRLPTGSLHITKPLIPRLTALGNATVKGVPRTQTRNLLTFRRVTQTLHQSSPPIDIKCDNFVDDGY